MTEERSKSREQMTPQTAQATLSAVQQVQQRGRRRAVWPRWAEVTESLWIGLFIALFLYPAPTSLVLLLGIGGIGFRFWCVRHFGAQPRLGWVDAILVASSVGAVFLASSLGEAGWKDWLPALLGLGYVLLSLALHELRRREVWSVGRQNGPQ